MGLHSFHGGNNVPFKHTFFIIWTNYFVLKNTSRFSLGSWRLSFRHFIFRWFRAIYVRAISPEKLKKYIKKKTFPSCSHWTTKSNGKEQRKTRPANRRQPKVGLQPWWRHARWRQQPPAVGGVAEKHRQQQQQQQQQPEFLNAVGLSGRFAMSRRLYGCDAACRCLGVDWSPPSKRKTSNIHVLDDAVSVSLFNVGAVVRLASVRRSAIAKRGEEKQKRNGSRWGTVTSQRLGSTPFLRNVVKWNERTRHSSAPQRRRHDRMLAIMWRWWTAPSKFKWKPISQNYIWKRNHSRLACWETLFNRILFSEKRTIREVGRIFMAEEREAANNSKQQLDFGFGAFSAASLAAAFRRHDNARRLFYWRPWPVKPVN